MTSYHLESTLNEIGRDRRPSFADDFSSPEMDDTKSITSKCNLGLESVARDATCKR